MSALLNYKLEGEGHTVVLIHGLFGNLDNLGLLARDLKNDHQVLSVDLRNHGQSFHSNEHSYAAMAEDVKQLLESLHIEKAVIIGHSMGGKVAMKLAEITPRNVEKLVVLDMSPVKYTQRKHDAVIAGLDAVLEKKPVSRNEAMTLLTEHIAEDGVRQFLGKSLTKQDDHMTWRFNVPSIKDNYLNIIGWESIAQSHIPTLFIKGGNSDYLTTDHQPLIQAQFKYAKAHVIANTGHWLHAEKPTEVLRAIRKFID